MRQHLNIKRRGVNIEDGLSISEIYRLGGKWASVEGWSRHEEGWWIWWTSKILC